MKIVYRTVENNYDNLTEMLNNQIDILGELHGELVRAFKALIHDIDIIMYYSNQSFQTDIDNAYTPVYESEYIQSKIDNEITIEAAYENVSASLKTILAGISDIAAVISGGS